MIRACCMLMTLLLLVVASRPAAAHGMRTAYVELHESNDGTVDLLVQTNASYGHVDVVMPAGCAKLRVNAYRCDKPLRGSVVRVDGLGGVIADAVLVAILRDGTTLSALLRPGTASWTVPTKTALGETVLRYARAGFAHVSGGVDHLLFLAALLVMLRRFRAVLFAETAFTLSHSIAFSASALGVVHVPSRVAEAAIALTLIFVALEAKKKLAPFAAARLAFAFGAVHGLGFAGGLEELGVPRGAVFPALAGFAVGVELAQLVFLVVVFGVLELARRLTLDRRLATAVHFATGAIGCLWFFERVTPMIRAAFP